MRILVACGSSGGHIFPALALIDSLKPSVDQILLVLPQKSRENKISITSLRIEYIHSANFTLRLSKENISGACLFLLGFLESLRIIIKFNPDVVVGFCSLNTIAVIFWAWLFRRNTIIHEQNVIPGRANFLLAKLVDKTAVSFSQTAGYLSISAKKIKLVGNPLRSELTRVKKEEALDFFGFKAEKFTLLITGGSQGSHRLNTVCFESIASLEKKDKLQIIHISGIHDFVVLKDRYTCVGVAYKIFDFFPTMQYAYSIADLVISRAGATTIAELQRFGIPAILVPYPYAYAHQLANARVLESAKAALIIKDEELNVERLNGQLLQFMENPAKLDVMRRAYAEFKPLDAASLLAKEVFDFYR